MMFKPFTNTVVDQKLYIYLKKTKKRESAHIVKKDIVVL